MFGDIVIDPPWPKRKGGIRAARPNQSRDLDYQTMSVSEIFALLDEKIFPLSTGDHTVWLWTIDQFLTEATTQMLERGYKLHARMIWNKLNGVAPAFSIRYCHEYLLWLYKPRFQPVALESRGKHGSVFEEAARQHSRKPNVAYSLIQKLYPDRAKIDVFSRENRDGWHQWGNQCDYFAPIGAA